MLARSLRVNRGPEQLVERRPRLLFLYTEAMGYTEALLRTLVRTFSAEVVLVASNGAQKSTPYELNLEDVTMIPRSSVTKESLRQLVDAFQPDIIYVSGWMDRNYLAAARYAKARGIHVVAGIDAQWLGTLKQRFSTSLLKPYWRRHFSYIWVPGPRQEDYAVRLGFRGRVLRNFLSADTDLFATSWKRSRKAKRESYPHRLLFAGRLVAVKNLPLLTTAFQAARSITGSDWTLVVAGSGPLQEGLQGLEAVECVGFQSPLELASLMDTCGGFCLPSTYDAWGVAVHESAAAGLPMILSEACGAGDRFLRNDLNGYLFSSDSQDQLTACLTRLMRLSDAELLRMAEASYHLSRSLNTRVSASSLLGILEPGEATTSRTNRRDTQRLQAETPEHPLDLAA